MHRFTTESLTHQVVQQASDIGETLLARRAENENFWDRMPEAPKVPSAKVALDICLEQIEMPPLWDDSFEEPDTTDSDAVGHLMDEAQARVSSCWKRLCERFGNFLDICISHAERTVLYNCATGYMYLSAPSSLRITNTRREGTPSIITLDGFEGLVYPGKLTTTIEVRQVYRDHLATFTLEIDMVPMAIDPGKILYSLEGDVTKRLTGH